MTTAGSHSASSAPRPARGSEIYQTLTPNTVGQLRVLRVSGVELDIDGLQVRVDGALTHVPMKEFQVLQLLMENAGRVVTRREILDAVWGEGQPDHTKTLEVHVLRLRKRLEPNPDSPVRLRTVRGLGYVFDLTDW
jgi:two-component system response regulator RegX3